MITNADKPLYICVFMFKNLENQIDMFYIRMMF